MRRGAYGVLVCLLWATACSSGSPSSPSASVASPVPLAPTNGAQIVNTAQPVTLVVQNATVSQAAAAVTYTFEVATDSAFANKVQTKTGVAAGPGGQTSLALGSLAPGSDYYWHAQATAGGTTGVFSVVSKFTIGTAVTINAPTALSPANGATVPTTPTLTVVNATRTGPAGPIAYRFDISTSPTFASVTVSASVLEGAGQTSYTPPTLALSTTFYWRAVAIDEVNLVSSPASAVFSFTTNSTVPGVASALAAQEGLVLWPNAQPPGTPGNAILGNGWQVQTIPDFTGVPFTSPLIDALREFDLLDRGMDPQSALNWCHNNGYANVGVWVPASNVVGFPQEYMALNRYTGAWDIIVRSGS